MIIGITGTDGAGKGSVVEYLIQKRGMFHVSGRALITKEIEARGMPVNRDSMRIVGNDLRANRGSDVIVQLALETAAANKQTDFIVESIRSAGEVPALKNVGGILIAVDAEQQIRYERIVGRGSTTDNISFEKFCELESKEMNDPDPNGMQKAKVMQMADHTIMNDGTLEELHEKIEDWLQTIT